MSRAGVLARISDGSWSKLWHHKAVRWLTVLVLASFLGSALIPQTRSIADAQVFKPRGKGNKAGKATTAKKPTTTLGASSAAKKSGTTPRSGKAAKPGAKTSKTSKASKPNKSKVAAARPSDLTPDPISPEDDYVLIEDLDEDDE